MLSDTTRASS